MVLQDIYDQLKYGELSQLAVSGNTLFDGSVNPEPEIPECSRQQLVNHINTALIALYTRFRLKEKTVHLQVLPNRSTYVLKQRFAIRNTESDEPTKYLLDTEDDVFDDTLIKVEQVSALRSELGLCEHPKTRYQSLKLNIPNDPWSVRTTSMQTLLLPETYGYEKIPNTLKIDYQASHPLIDVHDGMYAATETIIELPVTHLQALLYYVASRIHNPIGMIQEFHSGNSYYAKYEGECARLESENIEIDNMAENSNFSRQGFR